MRIKILILHLF